MLYIQHVRPMGRRGQIELLNHYDMIDVSCQVYRCDCSSSSEIPLPFLRLLKLHNSVHDTKIRYVTKTLKTVEN